MSREGLLEKIRARAAQDAENRRDRRFLDTLALLTAKGFLRSNFAVPERPNLRIRVEDAVWAGENVEPRILEVLPAAVLRMEKHFVWDPDRHPDLASAVRRLRGREEVGEDYRGVPYRKFRVWADFPLRDRRIKKASEKKLLKTYRLSPAAVDKLESLASSRKCSQAEVLEGLLKAASSS